jgi:intracellular sulfur oxidation DsrE/DsrF family protein
MAEVEVDTETGIVKVIKLVTVQQCGLPVNRKMVESLVVQGARFDICLNTVDTLERESGKRPEFIAAATPVQVGVAQILFLTENGYTLVRP